ncbi:MAG: GAF domain-containing protein [Archangium sp.]|nr:GAF domain-containing protein [Archangium sp.]
MTTSSPGAVAAGDWRPATVRLVATLMTCFAPAVLFVLYRQHEKHGPFVIAVSAVSIGLALLASALPSASMAWRGGLLILSLATLGLSAIAVFGPLPNVGLLLALASVLAGLVFGPRRGIAVLGLSFAALLGVGLSVRERLDLSLDEFRGVMPWVRVSVGYALLTGLLMLVVHRAMRNVELALDDARRELTRAEAEATERRRAERTLSEHEKHLRLAMEATGVAAWSINLSTKPMQGTWTTEFRKLLGTLDEPPTVTQVFSDWVHPDDRDSIFRMRDEMLAGTRTEISGASRRLLPDGRLIWLESRGRIVTQDGHHVLMAVSMDVTERRQHAERQLQAQAALVTLSLSDAVLRGGLAEATAELTEAGSRLLDVGRCSVWLFDETHTTLRCIDRYERQTGRHDTGLELHATAHPAYFAALLQTRSIAAHDARTDPRTRELSEVYLPLGVASILDSPLRVGGRLVGVLCHDFIGETPRTWTPEDESLAAALADLTSRALATSERVAAEAQLQRAYDDLRLVTRRLEAAKEEERRHISRELHDQLGQALTAIKLNLRLAGQQPVDDGLRGRLDDALKIIDDAISSTRELSRSMRPPLLDEVGLIPALQVFVDEQGRRGGLQVRVQAPPTLERLPLELETTAFRIVQEAMTNVLRHAQATRIDVSVAIDVSRIQLVVQDDGVGFDVEGTHAQAPGQRHLGLVGMRERAQALGGTVTIEARPGHGTRVHVELPTTPTSLENVAAQRRPPSMARAESP